jgi:hypothetical protein
VGVPMHGAIRLKAFSEFVGCPRQSCGCARVVPGIRSCFSTVT